MICKISTLGTNFITVKGTHHPRGTNSDVSHKFSPPPPTPDSAPDPEILEILIFFHIIVFSMPICF